MYKRKLTLKGGYEIDIDYDYMYINKITSNKPLKFLRDFNSLAERRLLSVRIFRKIFPVFLANELSQGKDEKELNGIVKETQEKLSEQLPPIKIPTITTGLKATKVEVPEVIAAATGIKILTKRVKSLLYTTNPVKARNTDADAIYAVYPFTPEPIIARSLILACDKPVMMGVGGGVTSGKRSLEVARAAEFEGALAVSLGFMAPVLTLKQIKKSIEIPVIASVGEYKDALNKIKAGADIINVAAGSYTPTLISKLRKEYDTPIMAPGGPDETTIEQTIAAGANAIILVTPAVQEIERDSMERYRILMSKS